MSPWVAWLIAEAIKLGLAHISEAGKFNSLTYAEAKAMAKKIGDNLSTSLPSPEELESGK